MPLLIPEVNQIWQSKEDLDLKFRILEVGLSSGVHDNVLRVEDNKGNKFGIIYDCDFTDIYQLFMRVLD